MSGQPVGALLSLLAVALLSGCAGHDQVHSMIYHYGSPWAQGELNGQAGLFLVDTGASVSVVDTVIAEKAGATVVGTQDVIATTGNIQLETVRADVIRFAGREHRDRTISVQDFGGFRAPGGRRQGGLIGSDFFLEYTLILDMARSRVEVNPTAAPHAVGLKPHRMRLNGGVPEIQGLFGEQQFPIWCKLDTGSGYASEDSVYLDVSHQIAEQLLGDRLADEPIETARILSLAGREELPIHSYGPVRFLGREFSEVRLVVHTHGDGAFSRPDMVLITGSLLRQFDRVEIDYPRRTVWAAESD